MARKSARRQITTAVVVILEDPAATIAAAQAKYPTSLESAYTRFARAAQQEFEASMQGAREVFNVELRVLWDEFSDGGRSPEEDGSEDAG